MNDPYVDSDTARLIHSTALIATERSAVVTLIGGPGTGKSTALAELARRNPRAALITMSPARDSMTAMLNLIIEAFGWYSRGGSIEILDQIICDGLAHAVEFDRYLIVDEAQVLTGKLLYQLVRYHKPPLGLPIVFAGNQHTLKKTKATAAAIAQIDSHVFTKLEIGTLTAGDVDDFAAEFNVEFSAGNSEAYALLRRYGHQRPPPALCQLLRKARHRTGSGPIRLPVIREAIKSLNGLNTLKALFNIEAA